jgi:hypothetical protein
MLCFVWVLLSLAMHFHSTSLAAMRGVTTLSGAAERQRALGERLRRRQRCLGEKMNRKVA